MSSWRDFKPTVFPGLYDLPIAEVHRRYREGAHAPKSDFAEADCGVCHGTGLAMSAFMSGCCFCVGAKGGKSEHGG